MSDGVRPTIELISYTGNPIVTAYYLWQRSKLSNYELNFHETVDKYECGGAFTDEVNDLFMKIIRQEIPVSENIEFVFMVNDDSIAHREQMVRHRIGHTHGDNYGVDIIPEASKSSYWSQSMRILDMGKFFQENRYLLPDTIAQNEDAKRAYQFALGVVEECYGDLVHVHNIPMEDARNIMPLAATMDISWKMSLQSLLHVLGKRSCWILQLGLWEPIIRGMIESLCDQIHPMFREIILPPCFTDGEFSGCVYKLENERRVSGEDSLCVCPLYIGTETNHPQAFNNLPPRHKSDTLHRASQYRKLWGRDVWTGEKLQENENG